LILLSLLEMHNKLVLVLGNGSDQNGLMGQLECILLDGSCSYYDLACWLKLLLPRTLDVVISFDLE